MKARTMVYLDPEELEALRARARAERISLAEAIRRAVHASLAAGPDPRPLPPAAYEALVAIGASGRTSISRDHDAELAKALRKRRDVR